MSTIRKLWTPARIGHLLNAGHTELQEHGCGAGQVFPTVQEMLLSATALQYCLAITTTCCKEPTSQYCLQSKQPHISAILRRKHERG